MEWHRTQKIALVGMFSALAGILMLFEIQLPLIPEFYKIDLSEIPALICSFMMGPVAGVATEFVKILVKLLLKGTSTAYVGEAANFIFGCAFIVPATNIYDIKKTKKRAKIALGSGTAIMTVIGAFGNAFVLLPVYAYLFGGIPVSALIEMGHQVNGAITNMFTFVMLAVVPLNLIKGLIVSVLTMLIYKKISRLIKNKI